MAKKICWGIFALIILVMGVRVVYVNATYPNARFKTVDSSEEMKYRDCSIKIDDVTYYSKSQWSKYANEQGFELEEDKHKIQYFNNINRDAGYEYLVSYDPESDYYVLTMKVTVRNDADTDVSFYYRELMNIVQSKMTGSENLDSYYFALVNNMKTEESSQCKLKSGEEKTMTYIYVTNERKPKLYAQIIDIKGYQLMKLNIEDKQ